MLRALARKTAPMLDFCLSPFALLFVPVAFAIARMGARAPLSRRLMDAAGVGIVRHHYYEPLVRQADLHLKPDVDRALTGVDLNEESQLALVERFNWAAELERFPEHRKGAGYYYCNGSFESGDAEFLYNMIRLVRPRRLIEIGSGYSTMMARSAIAANTAAEPGYHCRHLCIEPYEMAWLEGFGVEVIRERVERIDTAIFSALEENDILFIDSSHTVRPQGDVLHEFLGILPLLSPGVIVHVHDVFTPQDYPLDWIVNLRRMWDEQYILESFLSFNSEFEVILAVNWLYHNHRDRLGAAAPVLLRQSGREPGSFWIRRRPTSAQRADQPRRR